jgi:hypothetical protein
MIIYKSATGSGEKESREVHGKEAKSQHQKKLTKGVDKGEETW